MQSSHQIFCAFAVETSFIGDEGDGYSPPTLPSMPSGAFKICGYMGAPQRERGLNNALGYSIGSPNAAYRKRGARNPKLTVTLKGLGALSLLEKANRDPSGTTLPWLCFIVGVPGQGGWTEAYRYCKIGEIAINCKESAKGEAAEIEVTVQVEAMLVVSLGAISGSGSGTGTGAGLGVTLDKTLSEPLFWHDVRTFSIQPKAGSPIDLRHAISSFNVKINHNLERKNERNDFGDNSPFSNTNYHILEHNVNISGEIGLHERMPESLLSVVDGSLRAQNWGPITLVLGDKEQTQAVNLALSETFPQNYSAEGVDPGAQLSYKVPFLASSYTLGVEVASSGGGSG